MNYELNNFISINDFSTNGFTVNILEIISMLAIVSSILVIINKNPIISVLFLIALFINISLYLIIIGLTFIGISYLLVYVGAVSMLFLFILMLIDIRISELYVNNNNYIFLSFITVFIYFFFLINSNIYNTLNSTKDGINTVIYNSWEGFITENYDIMSIGNLLYSNYSIWLILVSLILLLAMVGAIIINIK
jgi:NADH-ubiquinone oxidoreductase chain 6